MPKVKGASKSTWALAQREGSVFAYFGLLECLKTLLMQ